MAKTDLILKKAELFERFAVYGNRKNFLKAIAQTSEYYEEFANMEKAFRQNSVIAKNIINKVYPDLSAADFETPEQALNMIEKTVAMHGDKFSNEDMSALVSARNNISNFMAQKSRYQQTFSQQFGDVKEAPVSKPEELPVAKKPSQSVTALINFYAAQVQAGMAKSDAKLLDMYVSKLENAVEKAMLSKSISSEKYNQLLDLIRQAKNKEGDLAAIELDKIRGNPYV